MDARQILIDLKHDPLLSEFIQNMFTDRMTRILTIANKNITSLVINTGNRGKTEKGLKRKKMLNE